MNEDMSLKAKIRNLAESMNLPAQVILQNFLFERFLARLSRTAYQDKFILKGGILVSAIVGLTNRATMDLDATVKGLPLSEDVLRKAIQTICLCPSTDGIEFSIQTIDPIRKNDAYGGYRVSIAAKFGKINACLSMDISTGDVITPNPVPLVFTPMFDSEHPFSLWAYNIETRLAEKLETILRIGPFNTRPRDFYDAYVLSSTQTYNLKTFREALSSTAKHRGTLEQISNYEAILATLHGSAELRSMWEKYRRQFDYAKDIEYDEILDVIRVMLIGN